MVSQTTAPTIASVLPAAPPGRKTMLLGEIVVELGHATREQIDAALTGARAAGRPIGEYLVDTGVISGDQLAEALAYRFGVDHVHLSNFAVDMAAANLIAPEVAKRLEAVPVGFVGDDTLVVAMRDPANVVAIDDIAMITGYSVRPAVATRDDIQGLVSRLDRFGDVEEQPDEEALPVDAADLVESAGDAPVVKLVNSVIAQAVELGASDIHFEPAPGGLDVRMRVDGVMTDSTNVPMKLAAAVISRLKIMANLDISERRRPQDGRIGMSVERRHVDLRAVALPLVSGESIVLRVLDQGAVPLGLDELGMHAGDRARLEGALSQAHGGVLATGPTGAGKSTTLYAALMAIKTPEKTIVTIEDPVEYRLDGIKQVQVNEKLGVTFASGLRSMMRADPDTIMVGEMRDAESAKIAVEAAITGHLVLSTLHTNDAPTAMTRLTEMGIEPYLVASSINAVIAQRLARRLCDSCREHKSIPASALSAEGTGTVDIYEAVGCARCAGTGYRGRVGLFEVMVVSDEVRRLVLERAPASQIAAVATQEGMRTLRQDGLSKVAEGLTSLAEVTRVTGG
ncbi:MAG: type pilus assembly protein PilB [Solirubrobacteraceae bacterium]|nr:type pilus assembly protein PilB [Solirubrobacteraceae bacterium]